VRLIHLASPPKHHPINTNYTTFTSVYPDVKV
jgi:hypothetical protein